MGKLEIARLGNPVLRKIAQPVNLNELSDPESDVQVLIDDMIETMRQDGGVGLAAPQVSRSLQVVVLECDHNERYPDRESIPLTALINPVITRYGEEKVLGWESCLSLIDFRGLVSRSQEVTVEAFDRQGKAMVIHAGGFLAVVLQHEIDHLNGKVFLDRMEDLTQLSYMKEFETYWLDHEAI
ncbi:MAG: peptide deformylase 1 [Nitrospinaceae bacterium]|nr:MAG: peptide deformylase 1 [Nitrospinaceae bacterium]